MIFFVRFRRFLTAVLVSIPLLLSAQFYNGYQMEFGKNRIQYDDNRFWSFMKFPSFDTYFYVGGLEIATYTGRTAGEDLKKIEQLLDYKLDGRIQFIIYNKLSEAKQTNIGLETEESVTNNIGGVTRIVGDKVFLYFNGNHEDLRRQIRAGIARVLIDQIMFGGDLKDRIQNSALLTLPDWYIQGLVSYISREWDAEVDNRVRDGVVNKRYLKFNRLTGSDALYAGHAFWKYIVDTYTSNSVSNLLYMTRINRNVESGFSYVLGVSIKELSSNFNEWLKSRYADSDNGRTKTPGDPVVRRPKSGRVYNQLHISPDGRYAVHVVNDLGRYRIMLTDLVRHRKRCILRSGYRSFARETDESFPVLAWHPTGKLVSYIRERKGLLWMGTYTLETKKKREEKLFNFEKVLDYAYSDDGAVIVLSGVQKGQSDIFVFNLRTRTYEQITKDPYDDLQPRFIRNSSAIVFASNRVNDTLSLDMKRALPSGNNLDVFYYDYKGKAGVLRRITNTPGAREYQPMAYDSAAIAYLSDENGIVNRYAATIDSALSYVDTVEHYRMIIRTYPQTDRARSVLWQDVNSRMSHVGEIVYEKGRPRLSVLRKPDTRTDLSALPPGLFRLEKNVSGPIPAQAVITPATVRPVGDDAPSAVTDSNAVDIDNYEFQSDFPEQASARKKQDKPQPAAGPSFALTPAFSASSDTSSFQLPKQRNYETAFSSSYFVSQLDNSLLNQTYQLFTGGAVYYNPGLNGFFKLGIRDVLEDYRISGGFKLSGDLNSNEYFLNYENLKKRLDKQLTFYRQAILFDYDPFYGAKLHSHEARGYLKWPFNDVSSIRGSLAYRNDRFVYLATDNFTLRYPNEYLHWGSTRAEYVYDNTIPVGVNLYNGTRLKFFGEFYRQIDAKSSGLAVLGGDVRYYKRIHREIIWANRIAAGTSFGKEKLIFYLGSTDNWISPNFNYSTPIDFSQNYYFQALATNLRGFNQNIRNGNSFTVINSELRIPLFRYLFNRPIKSDFVRNFQVIGFGDIGTAWTGPDPYASDSPLNNETIVSQPFVVTLTKQKDPVVGGYGFGLRSRLLGYFLRADWAWGVEDRVVQDRMFYFSLGLDF
jgi:hypothetical protein